MVDLNKKNNFYRFKVGDSLITFDACCQEILKSFAFCQKNDCENCPAYNECISIFCENFIMNEFLIFANKCYDFNKEVEKNA